MKTKQKIKHMAAVRHTQKTRKQEKNTKYLCPFMEEKRYEKHLTAILLYLTYMFH